MQDTKPNLPVVGGVYKHRKYDISARVLGIEGGEVINRYIHPSGSDGGMGVQTSVEVFRMGWFPEDQSPIPALEKSLRAFDSMLREVVFGSYLDRAPEEKKRVMAFLEANHVALAGESEKEIEDAG